MLTYRKNLDRVLTSNEVDNNFLHLDTKIFISEDEPTLTDDITKGFEEYFLWLNVLDNIIYICDSNVEGQASWRRIGFNSSNHRGNSINNIPTIDGSFAIGNYSYGKNNFFLNTVKYSFILGVDSKALKDNSFVSGLGLYALNSSKTCFGKYNLDLSTNIFEIGGGTSDTLRKNLFSIDDNGAVMSNASADKIISNQHLTTKDYVDGKSGTTTNRSTIIKHIGSYYFDTTLNKPTWWNGTNWTDANGTVV